MSVQASYDRVADEYVRRIYDELANKPFDRQLLDRFAGRVRDAGLVCEIGCGPGHVAKYLSDRGVPMCGVDISAAMVDCARRLNPGISFSQGDMRDLDVADGVWAAIVAFYSIIHVPRAQVVAALRELGRALKPGGLLLLAFHIGDDLLHRDEWWGYQVDFDVVFFQSAEMSNYLSAAGFEVDEILERDPDPEVEHPTRRAYILARKPTAAISLRQ
jgi:SAM-dependent methyltransferase